MITERERADRLAARAVGAGIGLLTLMISWLVGERLAGLAWEPPAGPTVAFVSAVAIGVVVAVITGRRLAAATRRRPLPGVAAR